MPASNIQHPASHIHTLIIRPGALGDAVLTLPVLHALHNAGCERLTVLGTPASWAFIRPSQNDLRVCDFAGRDWLGLFTEGAALGQAAQEVLASTQTAIVYLRGETEVVQNKLRLAGVGRVFVIEPPIAAPNSGTIHAASQLLDPLESWLGAAARDAALAIGPLQDDPILMLDKDEVEAPSFPIFALHPGSGGKTKCWPAERFAQLAARISARGLTPLVFFGPADGEVRKKFEALATGFAWQRADCRPLREILALLSCARGYAGNDSGMTHLAARACPTLAIFGPTIPSVWKPLGWCVNVLRATGGDLNALSVDEVEAALQLREFGEARNE